ncbi:hypothetical protein DXX93_09020 [Thalassotalea euphylliae]|uniref:DUF4878 domain-containing protein n=1 Tax=Thalassotalea euphylliae TaxID=1655234 RepID=A0A3E0TQA4_9GAMM|nr:hypothetical protein [Thalassotalea euphylliae]REL26704.1 hypothetical protein DXX93_09020 [Thalassotalea euphylliae]
MKRLVAIFAAFSIFLTGCSGEDEITELANPELVAVAFFDALYNQKDVQKAASVCTPKLARILLHYKSPTAVSRHLFNMQYDKVEISPDDTGVKVREQFKDDADIVLYFDGYFQNERVKDVKRISLKQLDGRWVIDKILKDPF